MPSKQLSPVATILKVDSIEKTLLLIDAMRSLMERRSIYASFSFSSLVLGKKFCRHSLG